MKKITSIFCVSATAISAVMLLSVASCESKSQAKPALKPTTVPVSVKAVRRMPVQRTVDVVGTLFADEEAVISAKVSGRIIKLYKDVGDTVEPGEPLVQLKPDDYQLAANKARLAMQQSLAKLGLTELPAKDYDVTKVPTVTRAQLQWENAQGRFNRGKKLFEAKPTPLLSEQEFADLETTLRVARSNYEVELLSARAVVAEAWALKGELDIAEQRLDDATTRAPMAPDPRDLPATRTATRPASVRRYAVTARYVNEGELVKEITPCYRLIDDNPIKLRAKVPERHISEIRVGARVSTRIEAYPNVEFIGMVARVNPQIDPDNRTFSIEVLISNDERHLRAGAFARAAIHTKIDAGVVFAPQEAIITFAGVHKVFTIDKENKAVEIGVDPGETRTQDNFVEISSGLKGEESLVVSGASKLATGVPVSIKAPATNPATRPAK